MDGTFQWVKPIQISQSTSGNNYADEIMITIMSKHGSNDLREYNYD